jgi:hypothetical protein
MNNCYRIKEYDIKFSFSNQTSTSATETPASDLLFHPANFLEVDENEDTPEQTDVEAEIMRESEESAEQVSASQKHFVYNTSSK